ncbi:MAG TPA: hypothetical protein VMS02_07085, partial [Solirubrobacteraceae bacterium]|nr:hypothetical protein [Solirubrobacteraceae bacterium]
GSSIGVSHLTALGAALGLNKSASGSGLGRPIPIGPSAVAAAGGLSIGTVLVAVLVLARHHHGVPPGAAGLASAAALHTTPVRRVARRALRRAPLPRGELPAVLRSTLALALPAWVAPLVVTERSLRPGSTIDAIATHLRNRRRHDVLLLLTGPGYSAETSLIADRGFAGAAVRLPSRLAPGRWVLAVEDLSAVRLAHGNKLVGHPEDRLGVFTVSARRRRGPGAA